MNALDKCYCPYCVEPVTKNAVTCTRCGYDFLPQQTLRQIISSDSDGVYRDVKLGRWTRLIVQAVQADNEETHNQEGD